MTFTTTTTAQWRLGDQWSRRLSIAHHASIHSKHFSTDEVYGPSENNAPFFETSNFNPTNPYSASKAAAELVINTYKSKYIYAHIYSYFKVISNS